jgi:hypothetical protein
MEIETCQDCGHALVGAEHVCCDNCCCTCCECRQHVPCLWEDAEEYEGGISWTCVYCMGRAERPPGKLFTPPGIRRYGGSNIKYVEAV